MGPAGSPGSLMVVFGVNLSVMTAEASMIPLPQTLAGSSVRVRDSAGIERSASLLYVSPGHVNSLLPVQLAGLAGEICGTSDAAIEAAHGLTVDAIDAPVV